MINEKIFKYIVPQEKVDEYAMEKNKRNLIIFLILLITFAMIIVLTITEGFMKIEEHIEYLSNIKNVNMAMIFGIVMLLGSTYIFLGVSIISIATIFIKKVDFRIRKTILLLPLIVCLFTLPACLIASSIVQIFNLI